MSLTILGNEGPVSARLWIEHVDTIRAPAIPSARGGLTGRLCTGFCR